MVQVDKPIRYVLSQPDGVKLAAFDWLIDYLFLVYQAQPRTTLWEVNYKSECEARETELLEDELN